MDDAKGLLDDGNEKSVSSMSSIEEKEKRKGKGKRKRKKRRRKMRRQNNLVRYV